jgi:hypothetical protein
MNEQREKTLSLVIVFCVLFSAMIDPKISAGVAILSLIGLVVQRHNQRTKIRAHHNTEGKTDGNDEF